MGKVIMIMNINIDYGNNKQLAIRYVPCSTKLCHRFRGRGERDGSEGQ